MSHLARHKLWVSSVVLLATLLSLSPACGSCQTGHDSNTSLVGQTHAASLYLEVSEDYSCPYLYTWDGTQFRIENDIYSVARGPDREYVDYVYINNPIVIKDGLYSFQLKERQSEESWTDYVALMVIDHPAGTKVGVDSSGNAHSFINPEPPVSALNDSGSDVLRTLTQKDEEVLSLYHSGFVVLDFSNVDITNGAKLVLDVDGFEGLLSGSMITEIPAIKIQTLENGSWATRYKFVPRELESEGVFDLSPYLIESSKVRLESVSCYEGKYHAIDYVGLDNSPDSFNRRLLPPITANSDGRSVLHDLLASDNYYAYLDQKGSIHLNFQVPGLYSGTRSFVFVSEGYYHVKGSTFYVQTWDGAQWVEHDSFEPLDYHKDTEAQFDLSEYLPDPDGEYKVRIEHRVAAGVYQSAEGNMDYICLMLDGRVFSPVSAVSPQDGDILAQIQSQDDVRWLATDKSVIAKFVPAGG